MKYESSYYGTPTLGETDNDELMHYGVLGMKWGIRRYQNKDGTLTKAGERHRQKTGEYGYHYKSWSTKHNTKVAAKAKRKADTEENAKKKQKLLEKAKKHEERAKISARLDKREEDYARSVKLGRHLAVRALTAGAVGGKAYQQNLAMMNGTKEKGITGKKVAAAVLSSYGGSLLSRGVKADYIRGRYKDFDRAERETAKRKKRR